MEKDTVTITLLCKYCAKALVESYGQKLWDDCPDGIKTKTLADVMTILLAAAAFNEEYAILRDQSIGDRDALLHSNI